MKGGQNVADKIELKTFPSNRIEALTILYLQNQNLNNISVEELVKRYKEIYDNINEEFSNLRKPPTFHSLL